MNKVIPILFTIIFFCIQSKAQDRYVKFSIDTILEGHKCVKGDILPFKRSDSTGKVNITFDKDVIRNVRLFPSKIDTVTEVITILEGTDTLIRLKGNDSLYVNVSSIPGTVILVSERSEKILVPDSKLLTINTDSIGDHFRLISKSAPSQFYNIDGLNRYTPLGDGPDENMPWWYYLLAVIIIAAIGFLVWKFIIKKDKGLKEPIIVKYVGGSLGDFAQKNNVYFRTLQKWNKEKITKDYVKYTDQQKSEFQKTLLNVDFIVGYRPKNENADNSQNTFGFGKISQTDSTTENNPISEIQLGETTIPNLNISADTKNISSRLQSIENLLRDIKNAGSTSEKVNQLNSELTKIKTEKENVEGTLVRVRMEKDDLQRSLDVSKNDSSRNNADLNALKQKVLAVDFLKNYCEGALAYFNLSAEVVKQAYDLFDRINEQNAQQTFAAAHLLIKFQEGINAVPVGNWMQIMQDIRDTGTTNNRQVMRSLSQIQGDSEKLREFQRLFFSEVLIQYSSCVLMLAEAFRNIAYFQVEAPIASNIQNTFNRHVTELLGKVRPTGLETKYIPLFKDYKEYLGQSKSIDKKRSTAYSNIENLGKDYVAEIVSFGCKTAFEETNTLIILT